MKKLSAVIIALLLGIIALFSFAGCGGTDNSAYEKRIAELESQIEELQNQIDELENKLADMENKVPYETIIETTLFGWLKDGGTDFIAICNSFDEFKEKCLSNGYNIFDSANNLDITAAVEKLRECTDEYFEDNAFVVCAFYRSSWSGQYLIEDIKVMSEKLTLYIKCPRSNTAHDVMCNVFLIAGLDKSLVSGITDLEYVLC